MIANLLNGLAAHLKRMTNGDYSKRATRLIKNWRAIEATQGDSRGLSESTVRNEIQMLVTRNID